MKKTDAERNGEILSHRLQGRGDPWGWGWIDLPSYLLYIDGVHAIEFTAELSDSRVLPIPQEVAAQLPKSGRARIIVLTGELNKDLSGDAEWRLAAYQQFLRDDTPEDAIYDAFR